MNKPTIFCALLAALILSACQTSHVVIGTQRPPISPEEVVLYSSPPQAPFETVAHVSTDSAFSLSLGEQSKMNVVIRRLKEDAAKLGANGLIITWLGDEYFGSFRSGNANATGNYGSTSTAVFVKKGDATAIYVSPDNKEAASLNNTTRFLGLTVSEVEAQFGSGERTSAEAVGISVSAGEEDPIVLIYDHDDWDRVMIFVFFQQRLEGVITVVDSEQLEQDEALRILDLFTDDSSWIKVEPIRPEVDFMWERADGAYYALVSLADGTFVVGNTEKMPAK